MLPEISRFGTPRMLFIGNYAPLPAVTSFTWIRRWEIFGAKTKAQ
jgi:hypothetical protein